MLDAGTLVCSPRKRVSSDWAMPSRCWCATRITASWSLAYGGGTDRPGSVRASLRPWPLIGPGQPTQWPKT